MKRNLRPTTLSARATERRRLFGYTEHKRRDVPYRPSFAGKVRRHPIAALRGGPVAGCTRGGRCWHTIPHYAWTLGR